MIFVKRIVKKVQDGLKQADLFGQEIKLNFQNDDQYKTAVGGFSTIVFIALLIVLFWGQIKNFVLMQDVEVSQELSYSADPSKFTINPKEMIFALQISQDNFTTRPYVNVTMQDRYYYREDNGEQIKIKNDVQLTPCTEAHFTQLNDGGGEIDWKETYSLLGLSDYLCPPLDYEFNLGGMFTSEEFYFQKISVMDCVNSTDSTDPNETFTSQCATQEEIDDFLNWSDVTFVMYFPNILVNPDNPDKPIQRFLFDEVFFELQPNQMFKSANIMFKKLTLNTDQSIFPWSSNNSEEMVIFEPGDFREFNQLDKGDNVAGEFFLRRSGYDVNYDRSYRKLDDIVAYLGGFIEFVIIGAAFFVGYYNDLLQSLTLANKLYNFDIKDGKNDDDDDDENEVMKQERLRQKEWKDKKKQVAKSLAVALRTGNFPPFKSSQGEMNPQNQQQRPGSNQYQQNQPQQQNIPIQDDNHRRASKNGQRKQSLTASEIKKIILNRKSLLENQQEQNPNQQQQNQQKKKNYNQDVDKITDVEDENSSFSYQAFKQNSDIYIKAQQKSKYFNEMKSQTDQGNLDKNQQDQQAQNQISNFSQQQLTGATNVNKPNKSLDGSESTNKNLFSFQLQASNQLQQSKINKLDNPQISLSKQSSENKNPQYDTYLGISVNKQNNQSQNQVLHTFQDQIYQSEIQNQQYQNEIVQKLTNPNYENPKQDSNQEKKKKKKHKKHHKHKRDKQETEQQQQLYNQNQDQKYKEKKMQVKKDYQHDTSYMNQTSDTKALAQTKYSAISTKAATNATPTDQMRLTKSKSRYDPKLYEGLGFTSRKEFLTKQFEEIVNRKQKLSLTWRFFLNKLFCGKLFMCEEVILIEKAKEMIRKELDIYYIIDQIKDIDKIKNVFLNKEQQTLFNFFPQPVIKCEDESLAIQQSLMFQNGNKPLKIEDIVQVNKIAQQFKQQLAKKEFKHVSAFQSLYEAYEVLMKQSKAGHQKSFENQRLIQLLGQEMKEIFETSKLIRFENDPPSEIPVPYKNNFISQGNSANSSPKKQQNTSKPQQNYEQKQNPNIGSKNNQNSNLVQNVFNYNNMSNDQINETERFKQKESQRQLLQDQSGFNLKDDYSSVSNNQSYFNEINQKQQSFVKQDKNKQLQELDSDQIGLSLNNTDDIDNDDVCNVEYTNRDEEERPKTKEINKDRNNNINDNFMKKNQGNSLD